MLAQLGNSAMIWAAAAFDEVHHHRLEAVSRRAFSWFLGLALMRRPIENPLEQLDACCTGPLGSGGCPPYCCGPNGCSDGCPAVTGYCFGGGGNCWQSFYCFGTCCDCNNDFLYCYCYV